MPVVDKDGNALPPTAEGLLEHVRRAREAKYAAIAASNANVNNNHDQPVTHYPDIDRRAAEVVSIDNVGNSGKGREKKPDISRGDTGTTTIERSTDDFAGNIRSIDRKPATSYASTNQYSGTGKESVHSNILSGIKKAIQPIREAVQDRAKGESKKKKPVSDGKRLNDTEGAKLRPKLVEIFKWQCEHADTFIQATTNGHREVNIWSSMDDTEIEIIVDFFIGRAKVNPAVAGVVRSLAELMEKIQVGTILAPRAYASFMTYVQRGFSIV